jgi:two-component system, sensor histidine kinase
MPNDAWPSTERDQLRARLEQAEETIRAIRSGEVDAVVVDGPSGPQVYALRSADQPYRALVERMQEGAAILTAAGDVLYCNQRFADLLESPLEDLIGGAIDPILDLEEQGAIAALVGAGSGTYRGRLTGRRGRVLEVYLSLTTAIVDDVVRRTLIVADLTELVRAQGKRARAERENRAKDEFVAMIAHELRNPLGAIGAAVHALEQLGGDGGPEAAARAVIERQLARLSRLMGDLLDSTNISTRKITLTRQTVEWAGIIERHVAAVPDDQRIGRRIELELTPVWVDADVDRLEQVLGNLIGNALKYTGPGGRIRVTLAPVGDLAELRVEDDGIGIPPELLPRIFDLFAQGEQALDRVSGGLGIGLAVVRRLAEAHGGSASASSDGRGRGSSFVVRLPSAPAPREEAAPPAPCRESGKRRVLLVEDNVDAREMQRMALELAGHEVLEADGGTRGLELLASERLDVALIDIGLPGIDGYEVARRFREQASGPAPLLVALTGYGAPEDRERSRAAGFDLHLVKPVDAETIRELLRRS